MAFTAQSTGFPFSAPNSFSAPMQQQNSFGSTATFQPAQNADGQQWQAPQPQGAPPTNSWQQGSGQQWSGQQPSTSAVPSSISNGIPFQGAPSQVISSSTVMPSVPNSSVSTGTAVQETKSGMEILGDSLVSIFDKYVRIQCLPSLVEGLQKEGIQVTVDKLESLLPKCNSPACRALLSSGAPVSSVGSFGGVTTAAPAPAMPGMPFMPQAGAFQGGAGGFMPGAAASSADKTAADKAKLLDPNFNDNFKPGCCLSYPTRGGDNKYKFCGNQVTNQYSIVCDKCRNSRGAARDLDGEYTQCLSQGRRFDLNAYRQSVTQKRIDYAKGSKGGKKANTGTVPSFGFNPMDYRQGSVAPPAFGGMNPPVQQQQVQQPMNNGPPRRCKKYAGPIPEELAPFITSGVVPIFMHNHKLMGTLEQTANREEQKIVILGGCDAVTGPIRKTTSEDWNMIKISDLEYAGPFIVPHDAQVAPQQGQWAPHPTVPQVPAPGQNPWNPAQQAQQPPAQQVSAPGQNPWNPAQQAQQPPVPQVPAPGQNPWNPAQQSPAQQPPVPQVPAPGQNPWNPAQQSPAQTGGQHQADVPVQSPWNVQQTTPSESNSVTDGKSSPGFQTTQGQSGTPQQQASQSSTMPDMSWLQNTSQQGTGTPQPNPTESVDFQSQQVSQTSDLSPENRSSSPPMEVSKF